MDDRRGPYNVLNQGGSSYYEIPVSAVQNEDDEESEDQRIKEKELQDLLAIAFDDIAEDDEAECSRANSQAGSNCDESIHNTSSADRRGKLFLPVRSRIIHDFQPAESLVDRHDVTNGIFQPMEYDHVEDMSKTDSDGESRYFVGKWQPVEDEEEEERNKSDEATRENDRQSIVVYPVLYPSEDNAKQYQSKAIETESLQNRFLNTMGQSALEADFEQLKIICSAKDRQMERNEQDFKNMKDELEKRVHALKQHLILAQDNNSQLTNRLSEFQNAEKASQDEISRLAGQIRSLEIQLQSVTEKRNEAIRNLQGSEATIESLRVEIDELHQAENLVRARENHFALLNGVKEKHQQEVYELKVELDKLKDIINEQEEEMRVLRENVQLAQSQCEDAKQEKARAINRLLEDLHESQQKCQQLILTGAHQCTTVEAENLMEKFNLLKDELVCVKRELELYVSASKLGITDSESSNKQTQSSGSSNPDGLISSLKSEVKHSLACLQNKNAQLQKVQSTYQTAQAKIRELQETRDTLEKQKTELEVRVSDLSNELNVLKRNLSKETNVRDLLAQVTASRDESREALETMNEKLSQVQINNEKEKQKVVNECREACLRLHEERLKNQENDHIILVQQLMKELDSIKADYVRVCQEKNEADELVEKQNKEKKTFQDNWLAEKEREFAEIKRQNAEQYVKKVQLAADERLNQVRKMWEKEKEMAVEQKALEILRQVQDSSADAKIDEYLDQINELELRVKETEELYKRHLLDQEKSLNTKKLQELHALEMKLTKEMRHMELRKDKQIQELERKREKEKDEILRKLTGENQENMEKTLNVKVEQERKRIKEELKLQMMTEFQGKMRVLAKNKDEEKEKALLTLEQRLCSELDTFLTTQKNRFLEALNNNRISHQKEKVEMEANFTSRLAQLQCDFSAENEAIRARYETQMRNAERAAASDKAILELQERCAQLQNEKKILLIEHEDLKRGKITESQDRDTRWEALSSEVEIQKKKLEQAESKYSALKSKVKKYHRNVHDKEKEYAANLAALTEQHSQTLAKVERIKVDVIALLNAKVQLINSDWGRLLASENRATDGTQHKLIDESVRQKFTAYLENLQADIMRYLNDCSQRAIAKIQEEVALASWLLSEHLGPAPLSSPKSVTPAQGSASITPRPEFTDETSGRGTMPPSNSETFPKHSGRHENALDNNTKAPNWSSTPAANCGTSDITRPTPGLGLTAEWRKSVRNAFETGTPTSSKSSSPLSGACQPSVPSEKPEDKQASGATDARFRYLAEKMFQRPNANWVKSQFVNFSSDANALKSDFWKEVSKNTD